MSDYNTIREAFFRYYDMSHIAQQQFHNNWKAALDNFVWAHGKKLGLLLTPKITPKSYYHPANPALTNRLRKSRPLLPTARNSILTPVT